MNTKREKRKNKVLTMDEFKERIKESKKQNQDLAFDKLLAKAFEITQQIK